MHTKLDKYLHDTFPKIYADRCGFEHGDGWFHLLLELSWNIQSYLDGHPEVPQVVATQVKSTRGGLCWYYAGGDEVVLGMVTLAETVSWSICQACGNTI